MTSVKKCFFKIIYKTLKKKEWSNDKINMHKTITSAQRETDARGMGECKLFCFTQKYSVQWIVSWGDVIESLLIKNIDPS